MVERVERQLASARAYNRRALGACFEYVTPNCRVRPRYTNTLTAQASRAVVGNVKQQPSKSMAALISGRYFTTCRSEPQIELYSV